jgi:hypothetical protein
MSAAVTFKLLASDCQAEMNEHSSEVTVPFRNDTNVRLYVHDANTFEFYTGTSLYILHLLS